MTLGAGERDEQQRELWRRGAQGWERRQEALRRRSGPVTEWLVDAIDPQQGEPFVRLS